MIEKNTVINFYNKYGNTIEKYKKEGNGGH
jgi:hypothetical protein